MLDDDDGIPRSTRRLRMPRRTRISSKCRPVVGSVEDIDGLTRVALSELGGQLDTLTLSAREGRRGLPELDIAEAYICRPEAS